MDAKQAIEMMLNRMNTRNQFVGGTFAGFGGGTTGNLIMQQRDANAAIMLWREKHDPSGLQNLAAGLHLYGNLTDAEYEQIMEAVDGDN